jgi:predicted Kef-type K+ transport protein
VEPLLIVVAFVLGMAARWVGLPPLVGFLAAGFALKASGFEASDDLQRIGDLGVTVLLFSIGLKLRVGSLLRREVWAGATLHMLATVLALAPLFAVFAFGLFADLPWATVILIAFALSFSSTVFAIKAFEEQGQSESLYARTAIGVLIVQDIIAVVFLVASTGKIPSPWALALLLLFPARRLLTRVMERAGHGELLLLLGIIMTLGGAALFELVQLKGDLGALVFGMLVADHPKAKELAGVLLSLKDLFLVGFFLSIGLAGIPTLGDFGTALLLAALVPIKTLLYFGILTRFRLRARTATLASLGLSNYSEFGLIVGAVAVSNGWLSEKWLLIIAVAVALTFVTASPLNANAHRLYDRYRAWLRRLETKVRLPEEVLVDPGDAEVVIFGMGRFGTAAYDAIRREFGERVIGIDSDPGAVERHVAEGRRVVRGDPTDSDFWERVGAAPGVVRLAMLALSSHRANLLAIDEMRANRSAQALVAATAEHDDDVAELRGLGIVAFNRSREAGQGFADFARQALAERAP